MSICDGPLIYRDYDLPDRGTVLKFRVGVIKNMIYNDSMIVHDHSRHENNGIRFEKLQEEHLEMALKWRTQPDVTRYMATDIEYDTEKQKQLFQIISDDESSQYWTITYKAIPVGLIALVDTNWAHRNTNWAYYIGETKYRLALR